MRLRRCAFTLIELLIVIAIIGILIASIAVAVTKAKEFANMMDTKNNMKNLARALQLANEQNNRLPHAYANGYGQKPVDPNGIAKNLSHPSIFVHLLPYLENKPLFDSNHSGSANNMVGKAVVKVFLASSDPSVPANPAGTTSFCANVRVFAQFGMSQPYDKSVDLSKGDPVKNYSEWQCVLRMDTINDGPTNTVMFATRYSKCGSTTARFYASPADSTDRGPFVGGGEYGKALTPTKIAAAAGPYPPYQVAPQMTLTSSDNSHCNDERGVFGHSYGSFGLAVAMGDASVRNLSLNLTGETWHRALHPFDGNALNSDW